MPGESGLISAFLITYVSLLFPTGITKCHKTYSTSQDTIVDNKTYLLSSKPVHLRRFEGGETTTLKFRTYIGRKKRKCRY
jgi:hypothetical protein